MFRILTLATATATAFAGAALADNYIAFQGDMVESPETITLDTVRADADGLIQVYDYHAGERGMLLGSTEISQGANSDVLIPLGMPVQGDVLAVMVVDGEEVDMFELDLSM